MKKTTRKVVKKKLTIKPKRLKMIPCAMLNPTTIKALRQDRGLTLEQAAKAAGMGHFQTWYRLESGQRKTASLATVVAMARALGSGVDALLRFEPEKPARGRG